MEFLLVILLVAVIASIMEARANSLKKSGDKSQPDIIIVQKKQCPPHQWYWQEIVDQDGNRQGERIVCRVCGPLSKSMDGSVE